MNPAPLPALFTATEVAEALRETEDYVRAKCRRGEWPHRRGARGVPKFTADDYARIVELTAGAQAEAESNQRFALAPRSRRAS